MRGREEGNTSSMTTACPDEADEGENLQRRAELEEIKVRR